MTDPMDPDVEGVDECRASRSGGMAEVELLRETRRALRHPDRRPSSDPALALDSFGADKYELTVDGHAFVVSDAGLRAFVAVALDHLAGRTGQ